MNINRYNYEEYFLLYVDNELSNADRKAVEEFIAFNPDLEEEFVMLKQSKLKPDDSLVLENKTFLYKEKEKALVDRLNYEEFFLLYADQELNAEERRAVETFASGHPSLQQELDLLMQARLEAEPGIVFPDKNLLYREAVKERVIYFRTWKMVAIAAMILLALGIFWIVDQNNKIPETGLSATNNSSTSEQQTEEKRIQPEIYQPKQEIVAGTQKSVEGTQQKTITKKEVKKLQRQTVIEKQQYAVNERQQPYEPALKPSAVAKLERIDDTKEANNYENKVLIIDEPYPAEKNKTDASLTSVEEIDDIAIGPVQTKNTLRGFFRKVTRAVGKATSIPAAEKSLLIGNIQIALK